MKNLQFLEVKNLLMDTNTQVVSGRASLYLMIVWFQTLYTPLASGNKIIV